MSLHARRPSETSSIVSVSTDQPCHSILLNGPTSATTASYSPSLSSASEHNPFHPSSTKIHFAPLPQVPPELKRRSSITLGVAARKNLLSNQSMTKQRTLYMSDEQWELYKQQYEAKNGPDVVDIGEMCKSGAKSLWNKVKVRSASVSSTSSSSSSITSLPVIPVQPRTPGAPRSPVPNLYSPPIPPQAEPSLGTVEEEDKIATRHTANGPPPLDAKIDPYVARTASSHGHREGDSAPRRIPSPPPMTTTLPEDDEEEEREEREEEEEEQAQITSKSPHSRLSPVDAPVTSRRRLAAVLGFDEGRYGR